MFRFAKVRYLRNSEASGVPNSLLVSETAGLKSRNIYDRDRYLSDQVSDYLAYGGSVHKTSTRKPGSSNEPWHRALKHR